MNTLKILYKISTLCLIATIFSCSQGSNIEKELKKVLNTTINFGKLDTIYHKGAQFTMQQLTAEYEFRSVVYLQDGCQPCYPKFIEWHEKLDSMNLGDNYTVLFVIAGQSYSDFMAKVLNQGYVDDRYYTIMDYDATFLEANKDIPPWILDASVLIGKKNKIKMVVPPWVNEEMTELFYKIVNN